MSMLYRLWERWKAIAHVIGNFQARLLLTLFYFVLLSPFGLGVRLLSDPLGLRKRGLSSWLQKAPERTGVWERARRQF